MNEKIKSILDEAKQHMHKANSHLESELLKIRAGKATPMMIDSLKVDYYGSPTPISQVGNVAAPDSRTLTIQPFEKKMIPIIEKAIKESNLGFNPQNDGILIRISVPQLTEDRRKQLVKQAKEEGEEAKVAIRNTRRDYNEQIKKLSKDGVSEDEIKAGEAEVQKMTDASISEVDKQLSRKEEEIMKV